MLEDILFEAIECPEPTNVLLISRSISESTQYVLNSLMTRGINVLLAHPGHSTISQVLSLAPRFEWCYECLLYGGGPISQSGSSLGAHNTLEAQQRKKLPLTIASSSSNRAEEQHHRFLEGSYKELKAEHTTRSKSRERLRKSPSPSPSRSLSLRRESDGRRKKHSRRSDRQRRRSPSHRRREKHSRRSDRRRKMEMVHYNFGLFRFFVALPVYSPHKKNFTNYKIK
ncbi:unnamed protein product [Arabis nemorensis]|uniref:Uncharacterized protein n=1 Tax=Arabis nemorensis TaxID=586526 RepID=A0A565AYM5_9BRAS|nr:unnamed protein product [Arabis nemorensis]